MVMAVSTAVKLHATWQQLGEATLSTPGMFYYTDGEKSTVINYEGNSISKLQTQVANYVFELSAGNCHR